MKQTRIIYVLEDCTMECDLTGHGISLAMSSELEALKRIGAELATTYPDKEYGICGYYDFTDTSEGSMIRQYVKQRHSAHMPCSLCYSWVYDRNREIPGWEQLD